MNDQSLRRLLTEATEAPEQPSDEFVARLGRRLDLELQERQTDSQPGQPQGDIMVLELDQQQHDEADDRRRANRRLIVLGVAAAVIIVVGLAAFFRVGEDGTVDTTDDPPTTAADDDSTRDDAAPTPESRPTEPIEVGETWLQAIIDNDRETFVALHAPNFTANDTLMVWRSLSFADVPDYYFAGFDALAVSLETDDDEIWADGCAEKITGRIGCSFTTTLIGEPEPLVIIDADLTVLDGLITNIRFDPRNDPPGIFRSIGDFLNNVATEQDLACMAIGFNSIDCGEHESDMMRRYFDYRDQEVD